MANEPNTNPPANENPPELTLESVVAITPDKLDDTQKQFIVDNAGELTDEQRETYKDVLEAKGDETIDPDKVEIKTRGEDEKPPKKESGDEEEDEEIDPNDRKTIGKIVKEELEDFRGTQSEVQELKDEREVDNFISTHDEFKPYKGVMLKYMAHPAYRRVPVENIAVMVAGSDLQKIGARKEREAAARAKATQDTGTTVREPGKGVETDWGTASKEAFEKKKNEVLGIR